MGEIRVGLRNLDSYFELEREAGQSIGIPVPNLYKRTIWFVPRLCSETRHVIGELRSCKKFCFGEQERPFFQNLLKPSRIESAVKK